MTDMTEMTESFPQPIDTAPHDGRHILGWNCFDGWLVYRSETYGSMRQYRGWFAVHDYDEFADPPTLWMPMPEDPSAEIQRKLLGDGQRRIEGEQS